MFVTPTIVTDATFAELFMKADHVQDLWNEPSRPFVQVLHYRHSPPIIAHHCHNTGNVMLVPMVIHPGDLVPESREQHAADHHHDEHASG